VINSIVAGNLSNGPDPTVESPSDISGPVTGHYSLLQNGSGATILDGSGSNIVDRDPLLGTLGNYGGPTQTIPLLPGSPPSTRATTALFPRA